MVWQRQSWCGNGHTCHTAFSTHDDDNVDVDVDDNDDDDDDEVSLVTNDIRYRQVMEELPFLYLMAGLPPPPPLFKDKLKEISSRR